MDAILYTPTETLKAQIRALRNEVTDYRYGFDPFNSVWTKRVARRHWVFWTKYVDVMDYSSFTNLYDRFLFLHESDFTHYASLEYTDLGEQLVKLGNMADWNYEDQWLLKPKTARALAVIEAWLVNREAKTMGRGYE